jgi:iron complex outermembrane recepter protein
MLLQSFPSPLSIALLLCVSGLAAHLSAQTPVPESGSVPLATATSGASPGSAGEAEPAQAPPPPQAADADTPLSLDETVEVTATRGTVSSDQSPASSSVVLRKDFERRAVMSVDQAVRPLEGVYAWRQRGLTDNEAGVGMRGFSGRAGGQSRVLILLDGQPVNNAYTGAVNWTALTLGEVERVEVVRGPYSSLYGGNAMGGVVNILTRPIEHRHVETYTQIGTNQTATSYVRGSTRLWGRLGVGLSYEDQRTGGYPTQEVLRPATVSTPAGGIQVTGVTPYLTRVGGQTYAAGLRGNNTYERSGIRGRAEYTVGPRSFASFQYVRQANSFGWERYTSTVRAADGRLLDNGAAVFDDNGVWRRITLAPSNFLGPDGSGSSNLYQGQWLHGTAAGGQLRVQGGVLDIPRDRLGQPGASATFDGGPGTLTLQQNRGTFFNTQWSQSVASRHALTVGTDVRQDQASIGVFPISNYLGLRTGEPRTTYSQGRALTAAVYAQDQVAVSETVTVTLGTRYDHWRTYDGASQAGAGLPTEPFDDRGEEALTGKAALVYRVPSATVLRTSVGTSFRSPSVFDLYRDLVLSSGQLLLGNPELESERLTSWEVGARQPLGAAASFDVTYYENRIRGLIQRSVDFASNPTGFTSRHFNAGRARTRGTELAFSWQPVAWLTARPTYTFTDARIVRNDAAPATVGQQVTFVPRHTAAGTVTALLGRATATGTARYQSAVFATDTNTDTVRGVPGSYDEFFELDGAVTLALTRALEAHVAVENLFDRQYYLFYRNPGRLVMAGLRVRF